MGRSQTEEKIIRSLDFILDAMRHHVKSQSQLVLIKAEKGQLALI